MESEIEKNKESVTNKKWSPEETNRYTRYGDTKKQLTEKLLDYDEDTKEYKAITDAIEDMSLKQMKMDDPKGYMNILKKRIEDSKAAPSTKPSTTETKPKPAEKPKKSGMEIAQEKTKERADIRKRNKWMIESLEKSLKTENLSDVKRDAIKNRIRDLKLQ